MVRDILDNPVYKRKIRYGHYLAKTLPNGKTTRVYSDDFILVAGKHEPIISEEMRKAVHEKITRMKKHRGANDSERETVHNIFNKIAKCPQCGESMVSCSPTYRKGDSETYGG